MRFVGLSFFVFVLAGCEITPEQRAQDVCNIVCDCLETSTTARQECAAECVTEIPPVTDECLDCVYANSQQCPTLLQDCEDVCEEPAQP